MSEERHSQNPADEKPTNVHPEEVTPSFFHNIFMLSANDATIVFGVCLGYFQGMLMREDEQLTATFPKFAVVIATSFGWWLMPAFILFIIFYLYSKAGYEKTKTSYTVAYGKKTGVQVAATITPTGEHVPGLDHDTSKLWSLDFVNLWLAIYPIYWIIHFLYVLFSGSKDFSGWNILTLLFGIPFAAWLARLSKVKELDTARNFARSAANFGGWLFAGAVLELIRQNL